MSQLLIQQYLNEIDRLRKFSGSVIEGVTSEAFKDDPTIREKFNTYRFADYKEKVIALISRVTRVSVETAAMRNIKR